MNDTEPEFQMTLAECNGGPYSDEPLLCGWSLGILDTHLSYGAHSLQMKLLASWVAQADLIAMRHNYASKVVGRDNGDWMLVHFAPVNDSLD